MPRRFDFLEGAPELAAWCVGQRAGETTVLRATYVLEPDQDHEPAIFVDLTLTDPPEHERTWPVDDVIALLMRVNGKARELLAIDRWYVRFRSANPTPLDYEDDPLDEEAC